MPDKNKLYRKRLQEISDKLYSILDTFDNKSWPKLPKIDEQFMFDSRIVVGDLAMDIEVRIKQLFIRKI